jgi:outer membrane lipoprotein-sorting protein
MNSKALIVVLLASALAGYAAPSPAKLYSELERHLQSLKSLEILYEAEGSAMTNGGVSGRLVWVKPDRFLHETPEWNLGQSDKLQWRYLKAQNTLILEENKLEDRWTPETVLLDLGKSFRPESVDEQGDGTRSLTLVSKDQNLPGNAVLEFPPESQLPDMLQFHLADGTETNYRITDWQENQTYDSEIFSAPDVPAENVIDFRLSGIGKH